MSSRVATSRAAQSHWGHQHRARQPEAVRRHRVSDRRRLRSMFTAVMGAGLAITSASLVVTVLIVVYLATTLTAAIKSEEAFLRRTFGDQCENRHRPWSVPA